MNTFHKILLDLPNDSFSMAMGLLSGLIHHFLMQYPRQLPLLTTLLAYFLGAVTFLIVGSVRCGNFITLADHPSMFALYSVVYVARFSPHLT